MIEKPPFFTVAIPVYNRMDFFKEALESVLNQAFNDFEVLIIDDYSTDGTWEFIKSINDKRIRAFRNSQNLGIVPNWIRCINEAKGTWFKFLMSDDLLIPGALEFIHRLIKEYPDNYVIVTNGITFSNTSPIDNILAGSIKRKLNNEERFLFDVGDILHKRKRFIQSWANPDSYTLPTEDLKKLVSTSKFKEVEFNLGKTGHCVDYYILHAVLLEYKTMIEIDIPTYAVRDHNNNLSKTYMYNLFYHLKGDKYIHYLLYDYKGLENLFILKHAFSIYFNKLISSRKNFSLTSFFKWTYQLCAFIFVHIFKIKIKF